VFAQTNSFHTDDVLYRLDTVTSKELSSHAAGYKTVLEIVFDLTTISAVTNLKRFVVRRKCLVDKF